MLWLWRLFIWLAFQCDRIAGVIERHAPDAEAESTARYHELLALLKERRL